MRRLLKDRFYWYMVILIAFTGIFAYAPEVITLSGITPRENWELEYYITLYRFLFLISVTIAAWRFGIKGGLVICSILGLIILPLFLEQIQQPNTWIDVGVFSAGILFSWLIGRQGEIKRLLEKSTEELQHQAVRLNQEITERKRIEEQLIMTDRLASIGELASGIAHELNNPLSNIAGFSQLLTEENPPEDIKKDLDIIHNEAKRACDIVKNLLTFARKHTPVKQVTSLNKIIDEVLKLRAYEQSINNIQIKTHFAPDLPEITVDYFQIQQVFLNIIINAESAMLEAHNQGVLTITTERIGNLIITSFADDGPGINKNNIDRIFDPFFTTKDVGKGTGLGLSICHGIVNGHNGKIYAKSELGKGTTFIIELPVNGHYDHSENSIEFALNSG